MKLRTYCFHNSISVDNLKTVIQLVLFCSEICWPNVSYYIQNSNIYLSVRLDDGRVIVIFVDGNQTKYLYGLPNEGKSFVPINFKNTGIDVINNSYYQFLCLSKTKWHLVQGLIAVAIRSDAEEKYDYIAQVLHSLVLLLKRKGGQINVNQSGNWWFSQKKGK